MSKIKDDMNRSRRIDYRALARRVLAVAKEGYNGDWACYIDAVKGNSHEREYEAVYEHGSKLPEKLARILFPNFKDLRYRS